MSARATAASRKGRSERPKSCAAAREAPARRGTALDGRTALPAAGLGGAILNRTEPSVLDQLFADPSRLAHRLGAAKIPSRRGRVEQLLQLFVEQRGDALGRVRDRAAVGGGDRNVVAVHHAL